MRTKIKIFQLAAVTFLAAPAQYLIIKLTRGPISYIIPQLWHKSLTRIFGFKLNVVGKPSRKEQTLYVGNHLSHFDIFILGGFLRGSFVAKDDLAKSPVIKFLSNLQQTIFISRSSGQASNATNDIRGMIERGNNIILFPEGTSTRGESVLPFKSSLFALPLAYAGKGLQIQPFTINLIKVDGQIASTKELRDLYAWDRDNPIELGPHVLNFTRLSGAHLQIVFHEPVPITAGEDRKTLARRIQEIVASPLVQNPAAV